LDILAQQKREEELARKLRMQIKREIESSSGSSARNYRSHRAETPSHPGGVNQEVKERIALRYVFQKRIQIKKIHFISLQSNHFNVKTTRKTLN
jgi:hypothetical protein